MYIGSGIVLLAAGILLAMFVSSTLGIILAVVGLLLIIASFAMGAGGRREVIVERERPVSREVVREREI